MNQLVYASKFLLWLKPPRQNGVTSHWWDYEITVRPCSFSPTLCSPNACVCYRMLGVATTSSSSGPGRLLHSYRIPASGTWVPGMCMPWAEGCSCCFPTCRFNQQWSWACVPETHTDTHRTLMWLVTDCHKQAMPSTASTYRTHVK